ncbi:MAG: hypothetical protein AM326_04645 [Candidatus Thorarchaeota archaeon SMTZ-45]|nr:MAG: hypothetical protein AM326_04645 [Candidatus Thorarchaeota archaeon SMTZ-45]KXH74883.1 MAG: hypothetical protein AM325_11850 [Candidatus Thorarchaeota archaeon SMTZ1-45]
MSLAVWWRRGSKPGLILMFLGIAGFVQIPIIWHAQVYVNVLSAELQILVSIGVMVVLGGSYMLMAEAMYRWAHIIAKRKTRRRQRGKTNWIGRLSAFARSKTDMPAFVGVGLLTCVFFLFYFIPFGFADAGNLPSWIATVAFLDPLFVYILGVNVAAIATAFIASYMNYKIK